MLDTPATTHGGFVARTFEQIVSDTTEKISPVVLSANDSRCNEPHRCMSCPKSRFDNHILRNQRRTCTDRWRLGRGRGISNAALTWTGLSNDSSVSGPRAMESSQAWNHTLSQIQSADTISHQVRPPQAWRREDCVEDSVISKAK